MKIALSSPDLHHLMILLANSEMSMILSLSLQSFQLENPIRQQYLNVVVPNRKFGNNYSK